VNGRNLKCIDRQRDLSVQVHSVVTEVTTQLENVVGKAYGMLAFMDRGIDFIAALWNLS